MYLGLNEREQVFTWRRKAYEERNDHLLNMAADPLYDPVRDDPRFGEMLRGVGLTP